MLYSLLAMSCLGFGAASSTLNAGQSPARDLGTKLNQKVVEVPVDLSQRHVAVDVSIGEGAPFVFNLDTYAVTTLCVDKVFAAAMEFEKIGTTRNGDGSGKFVMRDVVRVPEIRVGGATFTNVPALVDDYSWVIGPDGSPVKGLLGYHLFRDLLLELDYPNSRLLLSRGELNKKDKHVISHWKLKRQPDIPMVLGGKKIIVGIDSGAQSGLSLPSSWLDDLEFVEPPKVVGRARTVYAEEEIMGARLAKPLLLAGHPVAKAKATFSKIFGIPLMGHGILKDFRVTFDQKNGRVRFLPPKPKTEPERKKTVQNKSVKEPVPDDSGEGGGVLRYS